MKTFKFKNYLIKQQENGYSYVTIMQSNLTNNNPITMKTTMDNASKQQGCLTSSQAKLDTELVRLTPMYDAIMTGLYSDSELLDEEIVSDIIETQLLLAFRMGLEEGQERIKQELEARWGEY